MINNIIKEKGYEILFFFIFFRDMYWYRLTMFILKYIMLIVMFILESYFRLRPTNSEVGGWPPVVVSFQHFYDKEAVLKRTDMLDR